MLFTNTIHPKVLRFNLTALAVHEYAREDLKVLHFASQPLPLVIYASWSMAPPFLVFLKRPLHHLPQICCRTVGETHELGSQRPRHRFRRRAAGVVPELGSTRLQHRCRRRATGEACGL